MGWQLLANDFLSTTVGAAKSWVTEFTQSLHLYKSDIYAMSACFLQEIVVYCNVNECKKTYELKQHFERRIVLLKSMMISDESRTGQG